MEVRKHQMNCIVDRAPKKQRYIGFFAQANLDQVSLATENGAMVRVFHPANPVMACAAFKASDDIGTAANTGFAVWTKDFHDLYK